MNRRIIYLLVLLLAIGQGGCKKFLDVKPLDQLSGNSFFQDRNDVEDNLWDTYGLIRDKLGTCPFLPASGDLRSGMMAKSPEDGDGNRNYLNYIPQNQLNTLVTSGDANGNMDGTFHWGNLTTWEPFYQAIEAANILYDALERGQVQGLSAADVKRYEGEAVFIRCISYFIMIRIWGDVPYYTTPYQQDALPRMDMVQVAKNCIDDLSKVVNDLPWTYSDPAYLGIRASRGSALALLQELAMWNAGFDKANAQQYWQETADWGEQIVKSNAYALLPIEQFHTIFQGRTQESLFEFAQNSNYGEIIMYQTFPDMVLHFPYKRPAATHQYSFTYFRPDFLHMLYPDQSDARIQYWFDQDMYAGNGNFQFLKFTNIYAISDGEDVNPDGDIMMFRYAGAILMTAEAYADLGGTTNETEAKKLLNMVRGRSNALPYTGAGGKVLQDAIFAERAKELMGEGHYYFDLVRTGRVMDPTWDFYPLTQAQFNERAWTWPLNASVQHNNPYIQLNSYWLQ